jgi:hypothetical protein
MLSLNRPTCCQAALSRGAAFATTALAGLQEREQRTAGSVFATRDRGELDAAKIRQEFHRRHQIRPLVDKGAQTMNQLFASTACPGPRNRATPARADERELGLAHGHARSCLFAFADFASPRSRIRSAVRLGQRRLAAHLLAPAGGARTGAAQCTSALAAEPATVPGLAAGILVPRNQWSTVIFERLAVADDTDDA